MCIRTSWLKNKYLILVFTLNTVRNLVEVLGKIMWDYPSINYYVLIRLQIAEGHCIQDLCLLLFLLVAVH